jgi:hypothetical protein
MTTTKLIALAAIIPGGFAILAIAAVLSYLWRRSETKKRAGSNAGPILLQSLILPCRA